MYQRYHSLFFWFLYFAALQVITVQVCTRYQMIIYTWYIYIQGRTLPPNAITVSATVGMGIMTYLLRAWYFSAEREYSPW